MRDFCALILCPATVTDSLISTSFLVALGFADDIRYTENRIVYLLFQFVFLFPLWSLWLGLPKLYGLDLLVHSTGHSVPCYVAAWTGGESGENGYICTYGWAPLLSTGTITALSTSFTPIQKVKSKYLRKSHRVMDIKVPTTVVADTAPALGIWEFIPSVWTWSDSWTQSQSACCFLRCTSCLAGTLQAYYQSWTFS